MCIGLVTDGLPDLPFDALLRTAADLGIATLEFGCGNWSSAPHIDLDGLLGSQTARDDFMGQIAAHGLAISALNCSGNPLHRGKPGDLSLPVSAGRVDILLFDLTMPAMAGLAVIRAVQEQLPNLLAVLLTGYAGDSAMLALCSAIGGTFSLLRKPVSGTQLVARINARLESRKKTA